MACNLKILAIFIVLQVVHVHNVVKLKGRRDGDRMVVGFTTTYAITSYHH